jgi:hypothetical protein
MRALNGLAKTQVIRTQIAEDSWLDDIGQFSLTNGHSVDERSTKAGCVNS